MSACYGATVTPPVPPTRSPDDRAAAARAALAARRTRAAVKARVRAGYVSCSQVIEWAFQDTDEGRACARMTVGELLLCVPGVGPATADRELVALGISGDRRLRALGQRQREALRTVFW